MNTSIKYKVNSEKAIETIVLLSTLKPGVDLYHMAKTVFYAEKYHINRYGRPIIGDEYICGKDGPFPSKIRDLVHSKDPYLTSENLEAIHKAINVSRGKEKDFPIIDSKRNPNMDLFSESDIECLIDAFKEIMPLSFSELREQTHKEKAYYKSARNKGIDYHLLVDDEDGNDILRNMIETAKYAVL